MLPFENRTAEPTLTQEVATAVRVAMEDRLGLQQAGEERADALVRGTITRYEPDVPVAFTGQQDRDQVDVTRRKVQITVSVEIFDQRQNRMLWQRAGLMVEADYDPGQEAQGRERALDRLVVNLVEGAQSQW